MSEQTGWRWCRKCEGLFFSGHPTQGVCAADIGPHDSSESGPYVVDLDDSAIHGQKQWRWCTACEGLFFAGGGTLGSCPAGGSHTSHGSGDYILHQQPTGPSAQAGWRWCRDCQGMYFGSASGGVCPAGTQHSAEGSGDYVLRFEGGGEVEALSAGRQNMLDLIGKWMPTSLAQPRVPIGETQDLMAKAGWTKARGIQSKKDKDAGKPPVTSCGDILSTMLRLWHSNSSGRS